jgi:hypothetical protein
MNANTKAIYKIAVITIVVAFLAAAAAYFAPVPSSWTGSAAAFHRPLVDSAFYEALYIGAATLLLIGVGAYKAKLRTAYRTMALGILSIAIGLAQLPVLNAFNLDHIAWVTHGGVVLPFLFSGAAVYMGIRAMARLTGIQSRLHSFTVVVPSMVGTIVVVTLLPHVAYTIPRLYFDLSLGIITWDTVFFFFAGLIALQVKRHIGEHYTDAMAWLSLGFLFSVIITITALIDQLQGRTGSVLLDTCVAIGGLLYLRAGYAFAKTKEL